MAERSEREVPRRSAPRNDAAAIITDVGGRTPAACGLPIENEQHVRHPEERSDEGPHHWLYWTSPLAIFGRATGSPLRMKIFYSDHYTIDLPEGHRFPMRKYRMLRETLLERGIVHQHELFDPGVATREDVLLAHTQRYIDGVMTGTLPPLEQRRIGFPWSESLVTRSLATVAGCIASTYAALEDGFSGNLAGGTHHAMSDAGEGFCVFNDIAVSTLRMMKEGRIKRAAIIDLDVHQGNGNSEILGGRSDVFIFSMHGAKNYPFRKVPSTLDIDLPDGTGDEEFLSLLEQSLPRILNFDPDIIFYQCGVDPLEHDALGRLSLTFDGLIQRDEMVLSFCKNHNIPVMMALGGGYADPIEHTVNAQCNTYRVAKQLFL